MHLGKEDKTMKEIMMKRNIPTIDMISTGQRIVRLRKAAGMSVKDLQMIFGVAIDDIIVIEKTDFSAKIA